MIILTGWLIFSSKGQLNFQSTQVGSPCTISRSKALHLECQSHSARRRPCQKNIILRSRSRERYLPDQTSPGTRMRLRIKQKLVSNNQKRSNADICIMSFVDCWYAAWWVAVGGLSSGGGWCCLAIGLHPWEHPPMGPPVTFA